MPGEPAETLVGVVGVGLGALLLYSAVKNVSPVAIIRNAVTTGSIDLTNLPKLTEPDVGKPVGSTVGDAALKAGILIAAESIPDATLKQDVEDYVSKGSGDPSALYQRLVGAGFTAIAQSISTLAGQRNQTVNPGGTPI